MQKPWSISAPVVAARQPAVPRAWRSSGPGRRTPGGWSRWAGRGSSTSRVEGRRLGPFSSPEREQLTAVGGGAGLVGAAGVVRRVWPRCRHPRAWGDHRLHQREAHGLRVEAVRGGQVGGGQGHVVERRGPSSRPGGDDGPVRVSFGGGWRPAWSPAPSPRARWWPRGPSTATTAGADVRRGAAAIAEQRAADADAFVEAYERSRTGTSWSSRLPAHLSRRQRLWPARPPSPAAPRPGRAPPRLGDRAGGRPGRAVLDDRRRPLPLPVRPLRRSTGPWSARGRHPPGLRRGRRPALRGRRRRGPAPRGPGLLRPRAGAPAAGAALRHRGFCFDDDTGALVLLRVAATATDAACDPRFDDVRATARPSTAGPRRPRGATRARDESMSPPRPRSGARSATDVDPRGRRPGPRRPRPRRGPMSGPDVTFSPLSVRFSFSVPPAIRRLMELPADFAPRRYQRTRGGGRTLSQCIATSAFPGCWLSAIFAPVPFGPTRPRLVRGRVRRVPRRWADR